MRNPLPGHSNVVLLRPRPSALAARTARVPPIVRPPQRPVLDTDGVRIYPGQCLLSAGRMALQRGVVVTVRERAPWAGQRFRTEVLVRRPDGGVSILCHPAMTLVLANNQPTQEDTV